MKLSDIKYPLRVCVELLHYCFWSNKKTENMTASEIKRKVSLFFTDEQVKEAVKILSGEAQDDTKK